ncbi:MAG: HEAT repeat domain-containing protein, partial [Actinomycetota bacterium]|nr:HEAT repeat domain-containing protein [Actinomycetota bacterium]
MLDLLTGSAAAIGVVGTFTVVLLVARRVWAARSERGRRAREVVVRPIALALLEGEGTAGLEVLDRRELAALAEVLLRYAPSARGDALGRITDFCERQGLVDRAIADLRRSRRGWRRAKAAFDLGDMGANRAGPALLHALSDRCRDVRAAAVRSLGRLRLKGAAEPLVLALASGSVPKAIAGRA